MNFHKNYYKLCLPSLFITLAIIVLGIAFALIFGYNTTVATPYGLGGIIFYLAIYLLAISVFDVVYLKLRYNWSTGFVVVLKNFVDIILLLSIVAVVRVPLVLETVLACLFTTLFGNFISLVLLKRVNDGIKTENNHVKLNNEVIEGSIKPLLVISFVIMVVLCLIFGTGLQNMLGFALSGIIGILVSLFTAICILLPVWFGFVKRELKIKKRVKVQTTEVKEETKQQINENATQI